MREAVASILAARMELEGARVLELFAGTGAYAFELLSRGAAHATLVEHDPHASRDIEASAATLGLRERVLLVRSELGTRKALDRLTGPYDLVLADPPYDRIRLAMDVIESLAGSDKLAPHALLLLEHRSSDAAAIDAASSRLTLASRYRYGDTSISLLSLAEAPPPDPSPKNPA